MDHSSNKVLQSKLSALFLRLAQDSFHVSAPTETHSWHQVEQREVLCLLLNEVLWWETYFSSSHYLVHLLIWMMLLSLPHSSHYQEGFRLYSTNCFVCWFFLIILLFIAQHFYIFLIDSWRSVCIRLALFSPLASHCSVTKDDCSR